MKIGRKDVIWNFASTFMRIASGLIVLPAVLRLLTSEDYALWTVFTVVGSVVTLMDFGFSNSFMRNITYIYSGAKALKAKGFDSIEKNETIDYGLLKSVIKSMRRFYGIVALVFLIVFTIASPFYLKSLLVNYPFDTDVVWVAWYLFGFLTAYSLYTYYYGPVLMGRGMIKSYHQNVVIGQTIRITIIMLLLFLDFGLIALVIGQFLGDITSRTLCYYRFYDSETKTKIRTSESEVKVSETMKIMAPNAIKIGITTLGGFLNSKATILIASTYLSFQDIGSYGVTKLMVDIIGSIGALWFTTYYPKVTSHRISGQLDHLKRMYLKGKIILIIVFIVCGVGLITLGPTLVGFMKSNTPLLPIQLLVVALIVAFLESNHANAAQLLLTKNEVPFVKASILSGISTVVLLYLGLKFTKLGVWTLYLAPGIVQGFYQNWKWPYMVIVDLKIKFIDYIDAIKNLKTEVKSITKK